MKLLLDQGNSRLKWCIVDPAGMEIARGSAPNSENPLCSFLRVKSELGVQVRRAIACMVSSNDGALLASAVREVWRLPLEKACSTAQFGALRNGYRVPGMLGVDRWIAMIGAFEMAGGRSCIVADAGTALTVDAVDSAGQHVGGFIVPGMRSQKSLLEQGAALNSGDGTIVEKTWGRDTTQAISHGVTLGLVALIERAAVELEGSVHDTCSIVLTGGDSALLAPMFERPVLLRDDLLFRGLWLWSMAPGEIAGPASSRNG